MQGDIKEILLVFIRGEKMESIKKKSLHQPPYAVAIYAGAVEDHAKLDCG